MDRRSRTRNIGPRIGGLLPYGDDAPSARVTATAR